MKIRSVTCFYNPASHQAPKDLARAGEAAREAAKRIQNRGFEVQNLRLATTPFPNYLDIRHPDKAIQTALKLEADSAQEGFASLSLGPALPEVPESYLLMPDILQATTNVFLGGVMADKKKGVSLARSHEAAYLPGFAGPD